MVGISLNRLIHATAGDGIVHDIAEFLRLVGCLHCLLIAHSVIERRR